MSKSSSLSSNGEISPLENHHLRRQPQQKRGQQRVEKILLAATEVLAAARFAAATKHLIWVKMGFQPLF